MNNLKAVYTSEEGIKELVNMCIEGKLFEPITRAEDMTVHNYIVMKLQKLGFTNENMRKIAEFVTRLPDSKEKTEAEVVHEAYFGDGLYNGLD